ncbi:TetR/AcrR family transcriptional regulator [Tsukamurella ocularis]|uniref:TetR/AcrR family transcriptional regulator n=1 Tax=Tsukamurella ocularis TaxID=1970234 RepID=UPI002168BC6B|nr:TetR/AcrR family transcriptional regulator [Tsukamurella ocularis]MCS3782201.1 AcrR family transcriptional regulator [Tsukamurella ocularis]MCS3789639.1 AcrR family transcriptional regulator [Tsukamurella ocularis]MCS3852786.1 AcrR family transcriptional regulator [Tsukamurella ocularis]
MPAANENRTRAPHLPPDERRAALIAATRDALLEHGAVPTTRQIAAAAGVAEGTIFRVFDSKEKLLDAVMAESFDPAPLLVDIDAIDAALPLRARLYRFTELVQARFQRIFGLMDALGLVAPPHTRDRDAHRRAKDGGPALVSRLRGVIGDDADQLSVPPEEAIHLLRLLTFSGSHPHISDGHVLSPQRIVDVLLDGISAQPTTESAARNSLQ